ncbi:MAG: ATP-binding protein [Candidatus Entotheonellia bacterium]
MNAQATSTWHEANQQYLSMALARVRAALQHHAAQVNSSGEADAAVAQPASALQQALQEAAARLPKPSALDTLCSAFGLSPFERDVLLMCAGIELDAGFASLCAAAQGDVRRTYPTFSLALAALADAHWSALTPAAALRGWRLIEVGAGTSVTTSALRVDERILHYLTGVSYLDERLRGLVEPLQPVGDLPPSHRTLAHKIGELWSQPRGLAAWPVMQLCGGERASKYAIATVACGTLGIQVQVMHGADMPAAVAEREALTRLWEREAVLSQSALLVDCEGVENPEHLRPALAFLERVQGMLLVAHREPLGLQARMAIRLDVPKPSRAEQQALWHSALGPVAQRINGQVEAIVSQFHLSPQAIHAASAEALARMEERGSAAEDHGCQSSILNPQALWEACRGQARQRLDELAQRIPPTATWDDMVLPEPQRQTLREIAMHVRQRAKVYEAWGFAAKSARGLGISVLFAGVSGTGKTMAAEVLADELRLDLYRIDLSQVVSKYIGETEKNLRRIFDAAEEGGAILLFDEADALFGKRSEVKDSHDRYANIEVSYLLQRMEAYHGLAILTTNMKSALDPAFLRRIRFAVQFPFPDAAQRGEIWRRIFPRDTPTDGLDLARLARLNVAGGNIRNIALNAAFLAADVGEPVRMTHVLHAAQSEYAKLEKPLTEAETAGWR